MVPTIKEAFLSRLVEAHRAFAEPIALEYFQAFLGFIAEAPSLFVADMGPDRMRQACLEPVRDAVQRALLAYTTHLATMLVESNSFEQRHHSVCGHCLLGIAQTANVELGLLQFVDRFIATYNGEVPLLGEMLRGVLKPDEATITAWARHSGILDPVQPAAAN